MTKCLVGPVLIFAFLIAPSASAAKRDRDHDGLPDRWERRHGLSTTRSSAGADPDRDRLPNRRELRVGTHPRRADTDRDGLRDGAEVRRYRTNPRRADTDRDGLRDRAELVRWRTNPRRADTDGDGIGDGAEVTAGTNPRDRASGAPPMTAAPAPVTVQAPGPFPSPNPSPSPSPNPTPSPSPTPPPACTRSATPSTFGSQVSAASAGEVICLASGSYGSWSGTNKPVTLREQEGASASIRLNFDSGDRGFAIDGLTVNGGSIRNDARDITIRNSAFTDAVQIDGLANANVLFDRNTHLNIDAPAGSLAGRISLTYSGAQHSGVTIQNSLFAGGDADGVQTGTGVNILHNEFRDVRQGGPNHTDNIQMVGNSTGTVIRGNWVHLTSPGTTQGIAAYDELRGALIEDNVIDIYRAWGIEVYSDDGSTVRHNTLVYHGPNCYGNGPCGLIDINRKSQDDAGSGTIVTDNITTAITVTNGSSVAARHHNLVRQSPATGDLTGTPIFTGGANPSTYAGYQLAASSPGNNAASDGTDIGITP